jgi:peptidoglycan/LPS O-acetylase OafA/YrhL
MAAAMAIAALMHFDARPTVNPVVYTIGYSVFAGLGCWLVYLSCPGSRRTLLQAVLQSRVLIFFGKYSYALYIFHPLVKHVMANVAGTPRLIYGTQIPWQLMFSLTCAAGSVFVALMSWNLLEKRFLVLKQRLSL